MSRPNRLTTCLFFIAVGGLLGGCAGMGASSTEPLLSAAGFRVQAPETAQQREIFAQLPPYRVHRASHEGKILYAYKNEKDGVAFIGGEAEYQKYQQLAIERRIARDQLAAARMNESLAYGWCSAWGPYHYPRFYY